MSGEPENEQSNEQASVVQEPPAKLDVIVAFDTTGSMSSCLRLVRNNVKQLATNLFEKIADLRFGVLCFGEYNDVYTTRAFELTDDILSIINFIETVPGTGGYSPGETDEEAYEAAFCEAQKFNYREGSKRVLILIGDSTPHTKNYYLNLQKLDWREELQKLKSMSVSVYPVQATTYFKHAHIFYREVSTTFETPHLRLDQFMYVLDMISAVCMSAHSETCLSEYEQTIIARGGLNQPMKRMMHQLRTGVSANDPAGYADDSTTGGVSHIIDTAVHIVSPSRFQVMNVTADISIKEYAVQNSLLFKTGRGFYELTKPESISEKKEIVVHHIDTDIMYTGDDARLKINLPVSGTCKFSPTRYDTSVYRVFIQSTSYNRKLIGGTMFLYEMDHT